MSSVNCSECSKGVLTCKADILILQIRLTPNASKDLVEGERVTADGKSHLSVRVRAIPEKGKANKALIDLLAKYFDLPKRNLEVIRGSTSRLKSVSISADVEDRERIVEILGNISNERSSD